MVLFSFGLKERKRKERKRKERKKREKEKRERKERKERERKEKRKCFLLLTCEKNNSDLSENEDFKLVHERQWHLLFKWFFSFSFSFSFLIVF